MLALRAYALAALVAGLTACGPTFGTVSPSVVECVLPEDQVYTLMGRWDSVPIPIAFEEGEWDDDEISDILDAADTWNRHFSSVYGFDIFDYGSRSEVNSASTAKPAQICASGIVSGTSFSGSVAIYKQGTWPYPSLTEAIALTTTCPTPATPVNRFYMSVMEVNYQYYFTEGNYLPDLNTVMLHEFGHLLGLRHSCSEEGEENYPTCENSDYSEAVMYPVILIDKSTGLGVLNRLLQPNDQGRANCLYEGYTVSEE